MKKTKMISSVISALIAMSFLGGCALFDGDDKAVLEAAENYAEAIKTGDLETVAELTDDADDLEDEVGEYISSNITNDDREEIAGVILDSMSYEIDPKSVESSKKDGKASVEITFSLVDYEPVYEDNKDDGGDVEGYLGDLEDCDDVIEIAVKLELVPDDGDWLIKDKKFDNVYDIYGFYEDVGQMSWASFDAMTAEQFEEYCLTIFSEYVDSYDMDVYTGYYCSPFNNNVWAGLYVYTDDRVRNSITSYAFQEMIAAIDNGEFDGFAEYEIGDESGYILFDGVTIADNFYFIDEGECYGGVYYVDDTFFYIAASGGDDADESLVREFLDYIGYPAP